MTSQFTIDDIVTKRLTVDGKRIQSLNLGTLVVIDPSYNVGIGTDIPKLRLDISGSNGIRIPVGTDEQRPSTGGNGPTDLSGVLRYNTESNQYEGWALDGWQAFGGSSLQLYTKKQGKNPMLKLTKEITTYGGNDDGGVIEFCLKNQSNSVTYQAKISALDSTNNAGYGSLVFSTSGGGNPLERMIIDHDGNVGIGTTSPSVSLEIGGTDAIRIPVGNDTLLGNGGGEKPSGADGMIRYNNVSNQFEGFGNGYWGSLGGVTSVNQYNKITADDSNGLRFYTSGSSADIQRMKIDNNGYIGINIEPSSSYQLHVNGTMRVTGTITGNVTGNVTGNLTGNATSATKLQNSRTIGGVSFNGSANINLPGVNESGTQNTTGNASTVTNGVYTNTTQTISGAKTFTSDINISSNKNLKIGNLTMNQNQILNSSETLSFQNANSNDVSICHGGGNVGIGTDLPSYPLTVRQENYNNNGTAEAIPPRTPQIVIETDGYKGAIEFRSKWSTYNYSGAMIYTTQHGDYDTNLHLMAAQDSNYPTIPGITIDSYNNVGIGTDSPGQKLSVNGNVCIFHKNQTSLSGGLIFRHELYERAFYMAAESWGGSSDSTANAKLCMGYHAVAGTQNDPITETDFTTGTIMTLRGDGNVGIGTDSPRCTLNTSVRFSSNLNTIPTGVGSSINDTASLFLGKGNSTENNYWGLLMGTTSDGYSYIFSGHKNDSTHYDLLLNPHGGDVGIGITSPQGTLHVGGGPNSQNGINYIGYLHPSNGDLGGPSSSWSAAREGASIIAEESIFSKTGFIAVSDKRIKENIVEVNDNTSLQKVRDISCVWYNYKDKQKRGNIRIVGFIAQQVKEHLPNAVSLTNGVIPDEMRNLEDVSWNSFDISGSDSSGNSIIGGFNMSSDLSDCSGVKYRFYVCNDISENEKMEEVVGNEDNTFTFDQSWNNVFCYGKEVDDFHTLDKQKIFALAFSATQEIDKIQQAEKTKLAATETKLAATETKLAEQTSKLEEQTSKFAAAETEISTLNTKNQELESKLAEQTTILTNLIEQLKANNTIN